MNSTNAVAVRIHAVFAPLISSCARANAGARDNTAATTVNNLCFMVNISFSFYRYFY
jgi:hypothetical protein